MAGNSVCPPWIGLFLLLPIRNWLENPKKLFGKYIREGMTILEPGCGPGFFTLPLARMTGPEGAVVAVDVQEKMLEMLGKRAEKAGLSGRIDRRLASNDGLNINDYKEKVDLAVTIHMVHEVPDKEMLFSEIGNSLKPGGCLFVSEPRGHVSEADFLEMIRIAEEKGLRLETSFTKGFGRTAVFYKQKKPE